MAREWKRYTAYAEAFREPNVYPGPLGAGDEFVHYYRDDAYGLDYFGVLTADHEAWRVAQPPELGVAEYSGDVPPESPHIELALQRIEERLVPGASPDEIEASMALGRAELTAKGLVLPEGWVPEVGE